MRLVKSIFLTASLFLISSLPALADVKVVASIKPVHALVSAVMKDVGKPGLIIEGAGSPHTYAMKPSQAKMLEKADLIFWIGEDLEAFLEKPLATIAKGAKSVALMNAHGLKKLKFREGGDFEAHAHEDQDHEGHGHDDHKGHGHDDHKEHAHHDHEKEHKEHGHGHGHDDHKSHGHEDEHHGFDPHIWLDPQRAKVLIHQIEEALIESDPKNKKTYQSNAKALYAKLDTLNREISAKLGPVKKGKFIVFHDAYHYFENRFSLAAAGSITVSPEILPGAERIKKLRAKIKRLNVKCVFAEPQFEPKLIKTLTEGSSAKSGILDPLGAGLQQGPELYFKLIGNMANAFHTCLSSKS